jgi:hypothetical protein
VRILRRLGRTRHDFLLDGQTTYTIVLHTYSTPDHEWWFWTSF